MKSLHKNRPPRIVDIYSPNSKRRKNNLVKSGLLKIKGFKGLMKNPTVITLTAIVATIIVVLTVQWLQHPTQKSQLSNVLSEVGRIMYLPSNETPALAVVTNPAQLQSSLKSVALTGDDVLIYESHAQVIVYRPSTNKIVTVVPLLIGHQPNPAITVSIAILNGSGNQNNTQKFITQLYGLYPNLNLIYKDSAPRLFPTTIVFGQQVGDPIAEEMAQSLNIQAGQAPLGVPDNLATLTFIIGQDYK